MSTETVTSEQIFSILSDRISKTIDYWKLKAIDSLAYAGRYLQIKISARIQKAITNEYLATAAALFQELSCLYA